MELQIIWDLDDDPEGNVQHIAVVFANVLDDPRTVYPLTAYETPAGKES